MVQKGPLYKNNALFYLEFYLDFIIIVEFLYYCRWARAEFCRCACRFDMQSHQVHNDGFDEVHLAAVCLGVFLFLSLVFVGFSKCCRFVTEIMLLVGLSVAETSIPLFGPFRVFLSAVVLL